MKCDECGDRVVEIGGTFYCLGCGNVDYERGSYMLSTECSKCGKTKQSLALAHGGSCVYCGSGFVNTRSELIPEGTAMIDEECDFEKLART